MMSTIKICHVNAQSLLPHFVEFADFFNCHDYNIICVSETWLTPSVNSAMVSLPGYNLFRNDRTYKRGGGVGIYVKSEFIASVICFSNSQLDRSTEFLFVSIKCSKGSLLIGCVYRPPKLSIVNFETCLSALVASHENVVILGDFNSDLLSNNWYKTEVITLATSLNFFIVPLNATYHHTNGASLLDLIIVNDEDCVTCSGQFPLPALSMHDLIFIELKLEVPKFQPKLIRYRDFRSFNRDEFLLMLSSFNFSFLSSDADINEKVLLFNQHLLNCYDVHAPIRQVFVTRPPSPWLTDELRQRIKERNRLRMAYRRTGRQDVRVRFVAVRNEVQKLLMAAEKRYYVSMFSNKQNPSAFWKLYILENYRHN